jgi:hypothetical protein
MSASSRARQTGAHRAPDLLQQREVANRTSLANGMCILLMEALDSVLEASVGQPGELRCRAEAVEQAARDLERAAFAAARPTTFCPAEPSAADAALAALAALFADAAPAADAPAPPADVYLAAGAPPAAPETTPAPINYAIAVSILRQRLGKQIGPHPDEIAGLLLLRGVMSAPQVASALWAWAEPGPREVIRRMLLRTLLATPRYAADRELAQSDAAKIEQGCYNAAVRTSKEAEDPPRRQWDSEGFVSIYSDRCGAINGLLDPETEANRVYAADVVSRLLAGALSPEALGGMSVRVLCPKATEAERAEIATRQSQKVVVKESNLFMCPHCKARRSVYESVQRRALDEPADYLCTCMACNKRFTGRQ